MLARKRGRSSSTRSLVRDLLSSMNHHSPYADIAYLRHHVYLLTGCALVLGIVESIVYKKKTEAAFKSKYSTDAASKRRRGLKCECEKMKARAVKAVVGIEQDIRDVLGVSEVSTPISSIGGSELSILGILGTMHGLVESDRCIAGWSMNVSS